MGEERIFHGEWEICLFCNNDVFEDLPWNEKRAMLGMLRESPHVLPEGVYYLCEKCEEMQKQFQFHTYREDGRRVGEEIVKVDTDERWICKVDGTVNKVSNGKYYPLELTTA